MHDAIRATLDRLIAIHGGDPWHGPSTLALLRDVPSAHAAAHPVPGAHSIWEIVCHLTAWTLEATRRARGGDPADPEMGDWPPVTDTSAAAWAAAVAALTAANETLVATLAATPDDGLRRRVGVARVPALGTGVTVLETVEGVAAHYAYHAGQIALLKRALASRSPTVP